MPASDRIVRHYRSWASYFRGIDSKHNDARPNQPRDRDDPNSRQVSALLGFFAWLKGFAYRGYATEDDGTPHEEDFFACPAVWNPKSLGYLLGRLLLRFKILADAFWLEVHEVGHLSGFGSQFRPILATPTPDGGLDHEPPETEDIMVDGRHFYRRRKDSRELARRYGEWLAAGQVRTLHE